MFTTFFKLILITIYSVYCNINGIISDFLPVPSSSVSMFIKRQCLSMVTAKLLFTCVAALMG